VNFAAFSSRRLIACTMRGWSTQTEAARVSSATLILNATAAAGPLDVLVNSASSFPSNRLNEMTLQELHVAVDVNAFIPLVLSREFAREDSHENSRENSRANSRSIVNLLDTRIVDYDREHVAYHLSKRMLFTLTRMMAVEFAPHIRVNAVAPGLILPPPGKDEAYLEAQVNTNPLHRVGKVEDVARAVLFLVRSNFVTGQVLFVDGGRHLRGSMYGA
jgi:NAD(P)-dependent dehydrogenase (short-subunit alcohol dehydrogenase family)